MLKTNVRGFSQKIVGCLIFLPSGFFYNNVLYTRIFTLIKRV